MSPNVEQLTGYPVADFASGDRPYASIVHPDDLQRVGDEVAEHSTSGAAWFAHTPYRIVHRTGKLLWVNDYSVVRRNEAGACTHFFGYIMDITEQVEQFSRLQQQESLLGRLGNPILQVGRGVLAVPVSDSLGGERSARLTHDLLAAITKTSAHTAIIDLTGVQDVDATTISDLLRTSAAVRLLGCNCMLSGISPAVATMIVQRSLSTPLTCVATLQDALEHALKT